jgi:ferredoxin
MQKTKIYYFSGTGNSLWTAKRIAELLEGEITLRGIGAAAYQEPREPVEADTFVLVFPAYALGAPALVRRFVETMDIRADYCAALVTCGSHQGGALAEVSLAFRRAGRELDYARAIAGVENYIPLFGAPGGKTIARRTARQERDAEDAARAIRNRETRIDRVSAPSRAFFAFVAGIFRWGLGFLYTWYKVSPACAACGVCAKVCPVGAVSLESGRPRFSPRCEQCQACVNWCPSAAIYSIGRLKAGTRRFTRAGITSADMAERREWTIHTKGDIRA